jgi:hypothetical protein
MKLFVKNTISGLVPLYPADLDQKKHLKLGMEYEVNIKHPRNIGFHKKFFALINIGHENTSLDMPFDTYRRYVTMKAGYFKTYTTNKGTYYEAESISFAAMDQATFEEVYSRVLDIIIADIGATKEDIENVLINFM